MGPKIIDLVYSNFKAGIKAIHMNRLNIINLQLNFVYLQLNLMRCQL